MSSTVTTKRYKTPIYTGRICPACHTPVISISLFTVKWDTSILAIGKDEKKMLNELYEEMIKKINYYSSSDLNAELILTFPDTPFLEVSSYGISYAMEGFISGVKAPCPVCGSYAAWQEKGGAPVNSRKHLPTAFHTKAEMYDWLVSEYQELKKEANTSAADSEKASAAAENAVKSEQNIFRFTEEKEGAQFQLNEITKKFYADSYGILERLFYLVDRKTKKKVSKLEAKITALEHSIKAETGFLIYYRLLERGCGERNVSLLSQTINNDGSLLPAFDLSLGFAPDYRSNPRSDKDLINCSPEEVLNEWHSENIAGLKRTLCKECGAELDIDELYCRKCGARV